jgi:cyclohexa-1,5-dienecarbonyl-CoA hydratase
MDESFVAYDIQAGVAYLTLQRPPVNVINLDTIHQLQQALADLVQDESLRVLVLRATGKLFSAGVDVADHTPDKVGQMIPMFDTFCRYLAEFPVPTIAAVQGHALGGGCELVLCCDMAVMVETAKIGQPEIQLAAIAPVAAMRLPQLVGYRAAADLLFTGRSLPAAEALEIGLVNAVVAPDQLDDWVQQKVAQLTGLSRAALALCKRALHLGVGHWARVQPEMERLYLQELMQTADAVEGITAFMEKRPPVWKHG